MEKNELLIIAEGLYQEAFDANCIYLMIEQYRNVNKKHHEILGYFPAFYNLTFNALMSQCFMELAKLYDNNGISLGTLLSACKENETIFPEYREKIEYVIDGETYTSEVPYQHKLRPSEEIFFKEEVEAQRILYGIFSDEDVSKIPVQKDFTFSELLDLYHMRFNSLSKKKENLRVQRNKIYAHNDEDNRFNNKLVLQQYPISFPDVKELIGFALDVTRMVIGILTDVSRPEAYSNMDDFEYMIEFVEKGMELQKKEIEKMSL